MIKRILKYLLLICIFFYLNNVLAIQEENVEENVQDVTKDIADSLNMDNFLSIFEDYASENNIEGFDVSSLYNDLLSGNGIQYENILDSLVGNIFKEVKNSISSVTSIFIIVIIMAIVTSLELDKDSDVVKITKLVIVISISALLLKNYLDIVTMFKNIVNILGYIMQIVSTFLLGILMATGKITSTGIIEPLLLFIANFICFATEYIIIPFFTISVAINIVSRISENIKMDNLSSMFRKSSLYIFTTIIGIFLFVFSVFFYLTTIDFGTVNLGSLYYYTALYGLMIIVPILTMRMFAEERKTGTEQLILTSPVSMTGVVMGKLLAAITVICITLVISLGYFLIVDHFGSPNIAVVLVSILGYILISAAALSIGMFASSITENQIIAGIITIAFLIMSLFVQDLNNIFVNLAIMNFYQDFPDGVISFKEVISLLAFTAMFTSFTIMVMQRRKLVK